MVKDRSPGNKVYPNLARRLLISRREGGELRDGLAKGMG